MLGFVGRGLLIFGGWIASIFVVEGANNYEILRFAFALLVFTSFVALAAFWPTLLQWIREKF